MPKVGGFNLDILPHVFGVSTEDEDSRLAEKRKALLTHWGAHPWNWLMGEDLEEREVMPGVWTRRLIWTTDERELDKSRAIKAFPNLEFLYRWVWLLNNVDIKELLANKPRQMIFSTSTLLWMDHLNRFNPSRACILSKNTGELAEKLIKEKIRDVHERLPEWVKQALHISQSPQNRIDYEPSRSRMYAGPENVAQRHAVGGTGSALLIDEAGLQDLFQSTWAKAAPMCPKMIGITTAQFGQKGAADFLQMMEPNQVPRQLVPTIVNPDCPWPEQNKSTEFYESRIHQQLRGFRTRVTSRGFTVVDICLEADPNKRDPEVLAELERRQPNRREFLREYRGDWTSPAGAAYYSEFEVNGGAEVYSLECQGVIPGVPIGCGWDFGGRNPAAVMGQRDPYTGRIWVLRAIRCPNIGDTYAFRDLVMVLRGQLDVKDLSPKTAAKVFAWLDHISSDPRMPPWPWFSLGFDFRDFSSNEATRTTATVEGEDAARYDAAVLEARGLFLTCLTVGVKARENIVRKQLRLMEDGYPGLLVDPACPEVVEMFAGGLVYADSSKTNPLPDDPKRDDKYHDLHDATGYLVVGLDGSVSDVPVESAVERGVMQSFTTVQRSTRATQPMPRGFQRPGGNQPKRKGLARDVYFR